MSEVRKSLNSTDLLAQDVSYLDALFKHGLIHVVLKNFAASMEPMLRVM